MTKKFVAAIALFALVPVPALAHPGDHSAFLPAELWVHWAGSAFHFGPVALISAAGVALAWRGTKRLRRRRANAR